MGIFKSKKEDSLLQDPSVLELEALYQSLQSLIKSAEESPTLENFEKVFSQAEIVAFHYTNNCPPHFMLRLNHESLASYKKVQNWIYEAQSSREWALGGFLILQIGAGKSISKDEAQDRFDELTVGMTPIFGHLPTLSNALHRHGQNL